MPVEMGALLRGEKISFKKLRDYCVSFNAGCGTDISRAHRLFILAPPFYDSTYIVYTTLVFPCLTTDLCYILLSFYVFYNL